MKKRKDPSDRWWFWEGSIVGALVGIIAMLSIGIIAFYITAWAESMLVNSTVKEYTESISNN